MSSGSNWFQCFNFIEWLSWKNEISFLAQFSKSESDELIRRGKSVNQLLDWMLRIDRIADYITEAKPGEQNELYINSSKFRQFRYKRICDENIRKSLWWSTFYCILPYRTLQCVIIIIQFICLSKTYNIFRRIQI